MFDAKFRVPAPYASYTLPSLFASDKVFGTVELPDKPIMLPPFVEATHCLGYHLTRKGRAVADRVVSVLGYACPDITYSPSLYPITAALLHFMPVIQLLMQCKQLLNSTPVLDQGKQSYVHVIKLLCLLNEATSRASVTLNKSSALSASFNWITFKSSRRIILGDVFVRKCHCRLPDINSGLLRLA
ncbi:jg16944 [Pararge aegeria aegeria]|uniref:Jg16944 protein n=1 Tax=Pararge aegeria aegeria TaxID=348720 RepID=A0A8S4SF67_9NEOP|nr:jg16944 [Pararge aegeria aegeria]